jgi:hypothetical protein
VELKEFEFGFFSMENSYSSYFTSKKIDRFLDSKGCKRMDMELCFDAQETGSSHKIFIIARFLDKIEWKFLVSFKFVHAIRMEVKKNQIHVYISLIVQPK